MDDKVVSDLRQVMVSSTNKIDHHDVTEIFKVSLNTSNPGGRRGRNCMLVGFTTTCAILSPLKL